MRDRERALVLPGRHLDCPNGRPGQPVLILKTILPAIGRSCEPHLGFSTPGQGQEVTSDTSGPGLREPAMFLQRPQLPVQNVHLPLHPLQLVLARMVAFIHRISCAC